MKIALSLGSNKGDRQTHLFRAIKELLIKNVISEVECSTLIENPALLLEGSPPEWNRDFINCVIVGHTSFAVQDLLIVIQDIEKFMGRSCSKKWAPREIDIDILLYGDISINSPECNIPHIGLLDRYFVLLPLKEVAPQWKYPGEGKYNNISVANIVMDKYGL